MSSNFLVFLMFFVGLQISTAAVFRAKLTEIPGHRNECYYGEGEKRLFFPVGTAAYDDNNCLRYTCSQFDGFLELQGAGCGALSVAPPCKLVKGTGRYPNCCLQPYCP